MSLTPDGAWYLLLKRVRESVFEAASSDMSISLPAPNVGPQPLFV